MQKLFNYFISCVFILISFSCSGSKPSIDIEELDYKLL